MFEVGDTIVMLSGAPYVYTKYKSTGVVLGVGTDSIYVEFNYLSGASSRNMHSTKIFWVDMKHCELLNPLSQQERVCKKIKQMETRWQKFQQMKGEAYV